MSEAITVARPYAKAVFDIALETNDLKLWSLVLGNLSMVTLDNAAIEFITNPEVAEKEQVKLLLDFVSLEVKGKSRDLVQNFLVLLAENKRLLLLPEIYQRYEILRAEQEQSLTVQVTSFAPLDKKREEQIVAALSKKFKRQITLEVKVNPELLGGAVIQAGDLVIDGSVHGQLDKLARILAA